MADREADMTAPALLACPEPPGDWHTWLVEGDRSTGKTTRGARWLLAQALAGPEKSLWAVCAPTWDMARNSLKLVVHYLVQNIHQGVTVERPLSREHLVQDAAGREDVGGRAGHHAAGLFRRHEIGRA